MIVDAPQFYPGLDWQKVNRFITWVISKSPNVMIQPEGGHGVGWITRRNDLAAFTPGSG